jgi:nitroimidazol reductase NimA-like FMN-containing flavoprotein (pyridoxamine 5'-phosphate oxidase superfamily)
MRLVDHAGVEVIDRDGCVRLLASEEVGRLAVVDGGAPLVLPVNYVMDGEAIVIRTAPGTKLRVGLDGPVCFEIDGFNRTTRAGWSVVVAGRLEEVDEHRTDEYCRVRALPLDPWAGADRDHWLRLVPSGITGRRVSR